MRGDPDESVHGKALLRPYVERGPQGASSRDVTPRWWHDRLSAGEAWRPCGRNSTVHLETCAMDGFRLMFVVSRP